MTLGLSIALTLVATASCGDEKDTPQVMSHHQTNTTTTNTSPSKEFNTLRKKGCATLIANVDSIQEDEQYLKSQGQWTDELRRIKAQHTYDDAKAAPQDVRDLLKKLTYDPDDPELLQQVKDYCGDTFKKARQKIDQIQSDDHFTPDWHGIN